MAWVMWLGKLLSILFAFLQANPLPHGQYGGLRGRMQARRAHRHGGDSAEQVGACFFYAVTPAQAEALKAQQAAKPPSKDTVVDTIRQTEGYGRAAVNTVYEWKERPTEPGILLLFRNGTQVGGWNYTTRMYLDYDARANAWAQVCTPTGCRYAFKDCAPVPVPERRKVEKPAEAGDDGEDLTYEWIPALTPALLVGQNPDPPTGVDFEKLREREAGHTYSKGGKKISRAESFEAVAKSMPDDGTAFRLTCVGPNCNVAKLKADLAESEKLAAWKGKVTLQSYDSADDPMLKGLGFAPNGVQVLAPGGLPLWFAQTYTDADQLAEGLKQSHARLELAQARVKDGSWKPEDWAKLVNTPVPAPTPTPAPMPDKPKKPKAADDEPAPDAEPAAPMKVPFWCCIAGGLGILFAMFRFLGQRKAVQKL